VQFSGSDSSGVGSLRRPYRSITKALYRAHSGQRIVVGPGEYNMASGERFPLRITFGISLSGAGGDSTYITGPGGMDPLTDALIEIDGDAVVVEKLHLRSSNSLGVGAWIKPGFHTRFSQNRVSNNYIGIYTSGPAGPPPLIEGNRISNDSIGIVTADASRPTVRNCVIVSCPKYGVDIRGTSAPNFGVNDSTDAGGNTIDSCGNFAYHWLIYNGTTNEIWAVGNTWPFSFPDNNDIYIWDDDESPGTGRVILREP
jgi:parallel beta-helix repeat protein